MARRAPLHPRRAPYGRHWRDFSEELFGPEGALRTEKGLIVAGGQLTGLDGALQLHFSFKNIRGWTGGRQTNTKGAFGAQGGHGPVPPCDLRTPLKMEVRSSPSPSLAMSPDHRYKDCFYFYIYAPDICRPEAEEGRSDFSRTTPVPYSVISPMSMKLNIIKLSLDGAS